MSLVGDGPALAHCSRVVTSPHPGSGYGKGLDLKEGGEIIIWRCDPGWVQECEDGV